MRGCKYWFFWYGEGKRMARCMGRWGKKGMGKSRILWTWYLLFHNLFALGLWSLLLIIWWTMSNIYVLKSFSSYVYLHQTGGAGKDHFATYLALYIHIHILYYLGGLGSWPFLEQVLKSLLNLSLFLSLFMCCHLSFAFGNWSIQWKSWIKLVPLHVEVYTNRGLKLTGGVIGLIYCLCCSLFATLQFVVCCILSANIWIILRMMKESNLHMHHIFLNSCVLGEAQVGCPEEGTPLCLKVDMTCIIGVDSRL